MIIRLVSVVLMPPSNYYDTLDVNKHFSAKELMNQDFAAKTRTSVWSLRSP